MKWFVITLLCVGLAVAAYLFRDDITGAFNKASKTSGGSASAPGPSDTTPERVGPIPDPPKPPKRPEIDPDVVEKFPLPQFKSLEELVGNWQNIPASAFPRIISATKPVDLVLTGGVGKRTLPAGEEMAAIGISGSQLEVTNKNIGPDGTPVVSTTAPKGKIGIDDTDFKQVLGDIYDAWKKRKTNQVLADRKNAMRERREGSIASTTVGGAPSPTGVATRPPEPTTIDPKVGPRPEQEPNGKVSVMVSSIEAGDVSEIKLGEIERWGPVRYEMVDDEPYWTGTVNYKTATLFGIIDTEAMALIRKGKVVNWVYTGSGEDVP